MNLRVNTYGRGGGEGEREILQDSAHGFLGNARMKKIPRRTVT